MTEPIIQPRYIGDGVYASFDGHQIWLYLGSHESPGVVAIDDEVLSGLIRFSTDVGYAVSLARVENALKKS